MIRNTAFLAFGLMIVTSQSGMSAGPNTKVEELKPLDRYAGKWTGTVEGLNATSEATTEWILDGRFLQQKYSSSDGRSGLIVRGYDTTAHNYVMTIFDSTGVTMLLRGTWNEAQQSLIMTGTVGENTVNMTSSFPDENTENWEFRIESPSGDDAGTLRGTNKRVP